MPFQLEPKLRTPLEDGLLYILVVNCIVGVLLSSYYIAVILRSPETDDYIRGIDTSVNNNGKNMEKKDRAGIYNAVGSDDFAVYGNEAFKMVESTEASMPLSRSDEFEKVYNSGPVYEKLELLGMKEETSSEKYVMFDAEKLKELNDMGIGNCEGLTFESEIIREYPYISALIKEVYSDFDQYIEIKCTVAVLGPHLFIANSNCFQDIQLPKSVINEPIDILKHQYHVRTNSDYWSTMGHKYHVAYISYQQTSHVRTEFQEKPLYVLGYIRQQASNFLRKTSKYYSYRLPKNITADLVGWLVDGPKKYDPVRKISGIFLTPCSEFELCAERLVMINFCSNAVLDFYVFDVQHLIGFQATRTRCDISGVLSEVLRFVYLPVDFIDIPDFRANKF